MSFFAFQRVAEGYATHRPYYHPLIMQKIRDRLGLDRPVSHALDVGCGTGLSTVALRALADHVTGTDSSAEMIAVAQAHNTDDRITYREAPAEQLPFADGTFDLITVCGAINWIDRTRFLPEARRVLKKRGGLIIYDNTITDQIPGCPAYTRWYHEQFLVRFPKPPRDESPFTPSEADAYGFRLVHSEDYTNELQWSLDQYINFMLTQSNVIVAVDMGGQALSAAREWMRTTLSAVMTGAPATFVFGGYVWTIQRR
jgi:SAM-dependent methyltransferase